MIQTLNEIFMSSFTTAVAMFFIAGIMVGIFITRMGAKVARLEGLIQGLMLRLPKDEDREEKRLME